jgi:hypothetical protein
MPYDYHIDSTPQNGTGSSPDREIRFKGSRSSRLVEVLAYAIGLVVALIIAWYHDPASFF